MIHILQKFQLFEKKFERRERGVETFEGTPMEDSFFHLIASQRCFPKRDSIV